MGPLCPSKYRKDPCIKNFRGGVLRVPKILYALSVCVFYLLLIWAPESRFQGKMKLICWAAVSCSEKRIWKNTRRVPFRTDLCISSKEIVVHNLATHSLRPVNMDCDAWLTSLCMALVGACLATDGRILRQEAIVSQKLFAILWLFLLDLSAYNHGLKGPQKPKTYCDNSICDPIFHPLSLLLGRDPCGDRILRSCLQKGPATTPANYVHGF